MRSLLVTCAMLLPAASASALFQEPPAQLSIAAFRVGAVDTDASADFYAEQFGFDRVGRYPSGTEVLRDPEGAYLVITPASARASFSEGAGHVRLNFAVPDLDAAESSLRAAGIEVGPRQRSAVGEYASFTDPSGHRHNVKELDKSVGTAKIYNAGIAVHEMDRARAFYEGVLGFTPIEGFYPPAVPMVPVNGRQFILSDKGVTGPSAYNFESGAFVGLAFEVDDIGPAMADLAAAGVEFLHDEPVLSFPVLMAAFRDPFGNVHELIEHVTPEEAGLLQATDATAPTADDLAFLAGSWRGEAEGMTFEETWLPPAAGNLTGVFRLVTGDSVELVEIMTLTEEGGGMTYRLRHFDTALVPWKSEVNGPMESTGVTVIDRDSVRFEFDDASGVDAITYDREGDTLTARVLFPEGSGREPFELVFQRTD